MNKNTSSNGVRNMLRISVFLNLLFIFFFVGKRYYYSYGPGSKYHMVIPAGMTTDSMNNMGIRRLNQIHINKGDIVFIGTSITEGFPTQLFSSTRIKNFGIGWNHTSQIMNRLDSIAGRPSKIFIEAGINDIRSGISLDSIITNYKIILLRLKGSQIYIQSVLPVYDEFEKFQPQVNELNKRLQALCKLEGVTYLDITNGFSEGLTLDGLHPNLEGYKLWVSKIDSLVK